MTPGPKWAAGQPNSSAQVPQVMGTQPTHRGPRIGRLAVEPRAAPIAKLRGILAERVVISTELDPFLSLRALAEYSGLSVRTLRSLLVDPVHPLPCYRVGGRVLVRRSDYDSWAARYRQVGDPDLDRVVTDTLRGLRGA